MPVSLNHRVNKLCVSKIAVPSANRETSGIVNYATSGTLPDGGTDNDEQIHNVKTGA